MNEKYVKQMSLKEIGEEGQGKIINSYITIIGMGGLGCSVFMYLARMGVTNFKIIDYDIVETSNLARQVLYNENSVGKYKVDVASKTIKKIDKAINVKTIKEKVIEDNIEKLLNDCEIIIDCTDNLESRRLIANYTVQKNRKLIVGAVEGFKGWIMNIQSNKTSCYNQIFKNMKDEDINKIGVVGSVVGTIGTIMATETIKIILGISTPLNSSILFLDEKEMNFRLIPLRGE